MSKSLGNNTNWHANVSRRAANLCRNMCRWRRVTFSVSRRFFFNTRSTFHCDPSFVVKTKPSVRPPMCSRSASTISEGIGILLIAFIVFGV